MTTLQTFNMSSHAATNMLKRSRSRGTPKPTANSPCKQQTSILPLERARPEAIGDTSIISLDELAAESSIPWQILFQAVHTGEPQYIGLDILGLAVIGRADPEGGGQPDLDLTPYEAHAHGVSRRHAALIPSIDGLCLIDLDSANGTWVGDKYLCPGQRYHLHRSDIVEFGSLQLLVCMIGTAARGLSINSATQTGSKPLGR
jgi:hypothetical protein